MRLSREARTLGWLAFGTALACLGLCLLAYAGATGSLPRPWHTPFSRWDAYNYILIARDGYPRLGEWSFVIVWPPLYPLLIRLGGLLTADLDASALLVSNAAFFGAAWALYRLARVDQGEGAAERAAYLLAAAPTAYFFHLGYPESAFFACGCGAFYFARKRRWLEAGMLGGLAAALRVNGCLLAPALAVEALATEGDWRRALRAWPLVFIALGAASYPCANALVFGDPLHFLVVQRVKFGRELAFPWIGLLNALRSLSWRPLADRIVVVWLDAAAGVGLWAFAAWSCVKQRASYAVYSALSALMFTGVSFWISTPRYALCVFPAYLALAGWAKTRSRLAALLAAGACLQAAGLTLFALGRWAY